MHWPLCRLVGMSTQPARQVFQTASPTRWQRFQWSSRLFAFLFLLGAAVVVVTLMRGWLPSIPRLKEQGQQFKKSLDSNHNFIYQNSLIASKYRGFRQYITDKQAHFNNDLFKKNRDIRNLRKIAPAQPADSTVPSSIRAAFYVAWDPQSYFSLQTWETIDMHETRYASDIRRYFPTVCIKLISDIKFITFF